MASISKCQEILNTSLALFAKNGYNGTSTRDICQEVGIVPSGLYNYFKSKKDILLHIEKVEMEGMLASFEKVYQENKHNEENLLVSMVINVFAEVINRQMAWRVMAGMLSTLRGKEKKNVIARRDKIESYVRDAIHGYIKNGGIPDQDVRLASLFLFGAAEGMSGWYKAGGDIEKKRIILDLVSMYLRGIGADISNAKIENLYRSNKV